MLKIIETNFEGCQLCQCGEEWQIRKKAPFKPGKPSWWMVRTIGTKDEVLAVWRRRYRIDPNEPLSSGDTAYREWLQSL